MKASSFTLLIFLLFTTRVFSENIYVSETCSEFHILKQVLNTYHRSPIDIYNNDSVLIGSLYDSSNGYCTGQIKIDCRQSYTAYFESINNSVIGLKCYTKDSILINSYFINRQKWRLDSTAIRYNEAGITENKHRYKQGVLVYSAGYYKSGRIESECIHATPISQGATCNCLTFIEGFSIIDFVLPNTWYENGQVQSKLIV